MKAWWKESVVYQVYPRSFYDSNGDGIGDLKGVIQKLDYLKDLGIDVIWLNPVYKSPNDDMGYDIADYQAIMDEFGTMEDWEELLNQCHKRDIKLIMDLVVNHTSDEHKWFIESKKSKDSKYRDYYIWRDGYGDMEPNNWQSFFSVPAWDYCEESKQYYMHLFSVKQPDLNWDNKDVREEIFSMMRWWLDKGIDGFRMDVINLIGKKEGMPNCTENVDENGYSFAMDYYTNQPKSHEYIKEMNREVLSKYDIMTVGETPNVNPETASMYVDPKREELNMVFQFEVMNVDSGEDIYHKIPYKLSNFKKAWTKWQLGLEGRGWNSLFLTNHDQIRQVSRYGNDKEYRKESAKLLATLIHTLQGTPYIYQGEEIGMTNCQWKEKSQWRDVSAFNYYEYNKDRYEEQELLEIVSKATRDNSRTPMQWNAKDNAGFTTGTPWIKVNENFKEINVEEALKDEDSIYHYYKKLISLRKENPIMVYGNYVPLMEEHEKLFVYKRVYEGKQWLILMNFSEDRVEVDFKNIVGEEEPSRLILGNYKDDAKELRPYEARIYELS